MSQDLSLLKLAAASDPESVTLPRGVVRELVAMLELPSDCLGEQHEGVINYVKDQIGDTEREAHIAFLHPYLYHSGEKRDELNPDVHDEVMALCNGYGQLTVDELRERHLTWDWSHVRDSTVEPLARARAYLEQCINFRG